MVDRKAWSPIEGASRESNREAQLRNLIDSLKGDESEIYQGLGLMLERSVADGDPPEMIANHVNALIRDMGDLRDHIHQIMGTSRRD